MVLSRAPLSHPKAAACDLHALGTPPAFVLSQDQTLHSVDWNGVATLRTTRTGRVTCASSRFSCEGTSQPSSRKALRRTKNQGSARPEAVADTWRRLWPHGQRVSQKRRAREASCYVYRRAVRRRREMNEAKYSTGRRTCQLAAGTRAIAGARRPAEQEQ